MANVTKNQMLHGAAGTLGIYSVAQIEGQSVLRRRAAGRKKKSVKQSVYRATLSACARTFKHATTMSQKAAWRALGKQMPPANPHAKRPYLTGFNAFMSVNLSLYALNPNAPFLLDAPDFENTPKLPELSLAATMDTRAGAANGFTLQMTAGAAVPHPVFVYAAPMAVDGHEFGDNEFLLLFSAPSLPANQPISLSQAFVEAHGAVEEGGLLGVRVVPVTSGGFRGAGTVTTAVIGAG